MKIALGLDTSAYVTSVAAMDEKVQLIYDGRTKLEVEEGQRGLQQAVAVFKHLQNLPPLFRQLKTHLNPSDIKVVVASSTPRPQERSYMPVFTVGANEAEIVSSLLDIPLILSSHQEGHILAGLWACGFVPPFPSPFLALHLSGGTTEILRVESSDSGLKIKILGGTTDLNAGQFIDRVGVRLGLSFPAGPFLEKLAEEGENTSVRIPSAVRDLYCSFSGPESAAQRLIESGVAPAEIAFATLHCVARTLEKILRQTIALTGIKTILFVGGVSGNKYLRHYLLNHLSAKDNDLKLFFTPLPYSSDNACGLAYAGYLSMLSIH